MRLLLVFSLLCPLALTAQSPLGLTAYYPFESNPGDASGDATNLGVPQGVVDYDCGVMGQAVLLTSAGDYLRIPGGASNNVNREFDDEDFTVSLYFKPLATSGTQYLVSKRDTACANPAYFYVRYLPATRTVTASLQQEGEAVSLDYAIDNAACWQHLVLVRDNTRLRLFINGRAVGSATTADRIDVDNSGDLLLGSSTCLSVGEQSFTGLLDEVRIYGRALSTEEVGELYLFPDRILTVPTPLFLGQSVDISLNSNCGTSFSWTPTAGVESPTEAEPTITPGSPGTQTYYVDIDDGRGFCVARDSIVLEVIDPDSLDCRQVFVPKAFTPNGIGPEANETFGIANPYAVGELLSFEVYDRYGGQVFRTTDPRQRWDGTFRGEPVNPGVMLWRAVYRCDGEELRQTGSVTILR